MTRQYETEMQPVKYLKEIICDICNRPVCANGLVPIDNTAILNANWGYGSQYDTEIHECDICPKCYTKLKQFIENELRGTVHVSGPYLDIYEHEHNEIIPI